MGSRRAAYVTITFEFQGPGTEKMVRPAEREMQPFSSHRFSNITLTRQREGDINSSGAKAAIPIAGDWSRDTGEVLAALREMGPLESNCAVALIEAMVAQNGVREAAIAYLGAKGVSNPAVIADRILNDAEGVA